MSLQLMGFIPLPEHIMPGGFDHAAVHSANNRLYVAHPVNNALDVIDCATDEYLYSIGGLKGVAGALVSEERNLVFTSNRGENTVGIFSPGDERNLVKIPVGVRPNGLSFDPNRSLLLAASVGSPEAPSAFSLSIVDIKQMKMVHDISAPGRTRWTIFDIESNAFYVNISDPAEIVVVDAAQPDHVARVLEVPASGPHGLDLDTENRGLICACDAGKLVVLDLATGKVRAEADLSGSPDVIFNNVRSHRLYVAIGDPGVIDVFNTRNLSMIESITTEKGAHTIAFDSEHNKVYAFLPQSHQAAVFRDE